MSKLLPCPFCGGEAETYNPFDGIDGLWSAISGRIAALELRLNELRSAGSSDIYEGILREERKLVKVKLDKNAYMPKREHATDAGADIRTPKGFMLPAHCSKVVHTGVHIETPPDHVTLVKSKSGLYIKNGITVTGVVDEGFTGEIVVKMINHGPHDVPFCAGDKIAQLVIMPVIYPEFEQVDEIDGGERGDNGYGSTGR